MVKTILTIITIFSILFPTCIKKEFEGIITYKITVSSPQNKKMKNQIQQMIGNKMLLYYKNGKILRKYNGNNLDFVLYNPDEKREYTAIVNKDTIYFNRTDIEASKFTGVKYGKETKRILNQTCDFLIFSTDKSVTKYWYSQELYVDASKHKGNIALHYDKLYKASNSLPLRYINEMKGFSIIYEAVKVEHKVLSDAIFQLSGRPLKENIVIK